MAYVRIDVRRQERGIVESYAGDVQRKTITVIRVHPKALLDIFLVPPYSILHNIDKLSVHVCEMPDPKVSTITVFLYDCDNNTVSAQLRQTA